MATMTRAEFNDNILFQKVIGDIHDTKPIFTNMIVSSEYSWLSSAKAQLDILYDGHSADKYLAPIMRKAYDVTDGVISISTSGLLNILAAVYAACAPDWNYMYNALIAEYDPIENYSSTEIETYNSLKNQNSKVGVIKDEEEIDGAVTKSGSLANVKTGSAQDAYAGTETNTKSGNRTLAQAGTEANTRTGSEGDSGATNYGDGLTVEHHLGHTEEREINGFNSASAVDSGNIVLKDKSSTEFDKDVTTGKVSTKNTKTFNSVADTKTFTDRIDTETFNSVADAKTFTGRTDTTTYNNLTDTTTYNDVEDETSFYTLKQRTYDGFTDIDTKTGSITTTKHGNIGVTTNQQMIQSELELRKFKLFNRIMEDVDSFLTIPIY